MKNGFEISLPGAVALAGAVFYAGWIASAGYFQVATHWDQTAQLKHIEAVDLPKLKSVAGCQTVRANIATNEAVKSQNGADVDLGKIPNCPALPTGHPAHSKQ